MAGRGFIKCIPINLVATLGMIGVENVTDMRPVHNLFKKDTIEYYQIWYNPEED